MTSSIPTALELELNKMGVVPIKEKKVEEPLPPPDKREFRKYNGEF